MDILLNVIAGFAIGVGVVGAAAVVYNIITKSNIAEKIKEELFRKRPDIDPIEIKENDIFAAIVNKKQKDSVNVDAFFGNKKAPKIVKVTLIADEIADDIKEGDWISFAESGHYTMDDEDFFSDAIPVADYDALPRIDYDALPDSLC